MTWYAVHDGSGVLVSIGTSVAERLPDGLTAVVVPDELAEAFRSGTALWDEKALGLVADNRPPEPTLEKLYTDLVDKLVEKGTLTAQEGGDVKPTSRETGEIAVPVDAVVSGRRT